jgi:hypothetical protein
LGTTGTRPEPVPTAPTSSGQPVGVADSTITAPQRLNTVVAQQNSNAVVDVVSNGTTQVVASSDDSGSSTLTQNQVVV